MSVFHWQRGKIVISLKGMMTSECLSGKAKGKTCQPLIHF